MRISLLRFFKKFHKFTLCEFWAILFHQCNFLGKNICLMRIFGYFISLVRFFGLIWLMRILANANFFQNQKSHQARTLCIRKSSHLVKSHELKCHFIVPSPSTALGQNNRKLSYKTWSVKKTSFRAYLVNILKALGSFFK